MYTCNVTVELFVSPTTVKAVFDGDFHPFVVLFLVCQRDISKSYGCGCLKLLEIIDQKENKAACSPASCVLFITYLFCFGLVQFLLQATVCNVLPFTPTTP